MKNYLCEIPDAVEAYQRARWSVHYMEQRHCVDFGVGETIAAVGLAVSVASAAASTAAAVNQAQQQQKAAQYNAQVAANNQQVEVWQRQQQEQEFAAQALVTQQEGAQSASRLEMQNNSIVARNVAAAASSGLAITGSTQDVISGSAANNELSVLNLQHKTALDAWQNEIGASNASYNSTIQANRDQAESGLYSMEAQNAATSGLFSAAGAGMSGAARMASSGFSMYDSLQSNSPPSNPNLIAQNESIFD